MKDRTIGTVRLYRPKNALARLDVAPFFLAYSVLHAAAWPEYPSTPFWVLAVFPAVLFLHALTHLSTHWSVDCLAMVAYSKVSRADCHYHRWSMVAKLMDSCCAV